MFQNGQRVCFKNGGDPARIQKVQLAYGKDRSRAPQVIPTTDTNATQVQIVTGEDAARYPFIDPIGLIGAPAAWFRADTGVTVTGLGASTWADQSGNGRDLLQGTDANRPPYLSYSGTKYLYLPGVASNSASTGDSAPISFTGSIDIQVYASLADWTPTAINVLLEKANAGATTSYLLYVTNTTGVLTYSYYNATTLGVINSASTAAPTVTDGDSLWVRVTHNTTTGDVTFYTGGGGSTPTWSQLGNVVSTAAGLRNDTAGSLAVGARPFDGSLPTNGKLYRALVYSGIGGTLVADFNPNADASDASTSFTSSATGEVWTINKSGGLPAQIVGRPSLLFDGSADYLKCNAFTLNQPETVYIAFKQVSWTNADHIFDGNGSDSGVLYQTNLTPNIVLYAGTANAATNGNLSVGTYGVACAVINGASSLIQVNNTTATTGNPGASNMGGFTLGAIGAGSSSWANIQCLEVILFSTAHDATQRARIIQYLAGRSGIAL